MINKKEISNVRKVPSREVKMHFLLADACKEIFERKGILRNPTREEFEQAYQKISDQYSRFSEEELDKQMGERDHARLERYNSLEWYRGRVNLKDLGSWPGMDGLDVKLTTGNLPETVERVKKVWAGQSDLSVPKHFKEKIESIFNYRDIILSKFPIILYPGGLERGSHNRWVEEDGVREGEIPEIEKDAWLCKILPYDIDAGNSRAFAYSFSGLDEVEAYIGREKLLRDWDKTQTS